MHKFEWHLKLHWIKFKSYEIDKRWTNSFILSSKSDSWLNMENITIYIREINFAYMQRKVTVNNLGSFKIEK